MKITRSILLALLLFTFLTTSIQAQEIVVSPVTTVTQLNTDPVRMTPNVKNADFLVDQLFAALSDNDYASFAHYYNPQMRNSISGTIKQPLSPAAFALLRNEFLQNGRHLIDKRIIYGDEAVNMVRNDYIATFENSAYIARIGIIATNNTGNRSVVDFWISWLDSAKIAAASQLTDELIRSIQQHDSTHAADYLSSYSPEDFSVLQAALAGELGAYEKKELTFASDRNALLSLSYNLFFEKSAKPIKFEITFDTKKAPYVVKNFDFQWIPRTVQQDVSALTQKSLLALLREDTYDEFISYFEPTISGSFSHEKYIDLKKAILQPYGPYASNELISVSIAKTVSQTGGSPLKKWLFQYKLHFENGKELLLTTSCKLNSSQLQLSSLKFQFSSSPGTPSFPLP